LSSGSTAGGVPLASAALVRVMNVIVPPFTFIASVEAVLFAEHCRCSQKLMKQFA